jgi:hypothetical protein
LQHSKTEEKKLTPSSPTPRRAGRPRTSDLPLVPLSISIDSVTKEKLEQVARAQERSVSFIFREALKLYFVKRRKAA